MIVDIYKIAYAIDSENNIFSIFPIYFNDALVKLRVMHKGIETGENFRILKGDLFEDYILLDHDRKVIHIPQYKEEI